ncbi:saccharopine dehydrogenase NADP-binding domain-containing protein [Eubacterium sp. AB3007]|uniref:lactate/malate family dehydrogenase n=1 Tax=Eubacterium sp. AB3007 TaxID=1392487 RepID=UPI0004862A43|nr:saccharopine dehydrogenase NADP-binding domain-containing protein [Eubacterium sp. AB3007]
MKAAIIGAGNVGKTIFHDLQRVRMIEEITLVGRSLDKIRAEVEDARDAAVVREEYGPRLHYGGYEATAGADIIIFTAGSSKVVSSDRMAMLHDNVAIAREIFSEVVRYNEDAIIINATNPLDPITMKIQQVTGQDPRKVIGSGTLLETARLVRYIAELLDLSDRSVHMSVVGEHGASAVALLSTVRVLGMTLQEYLASVTGESLPLNAEKLNETFKKEAFRIFHGKGYTSTGVSATVCRIAAAIAADSREIFPVSTVLQGEYGVQGVAVSVPSVIGRSGVEDIREVVMSDEENAAFLSSVDIIRKAALTEGLL